MQTRPPSAEQHRLERDVERVLDLDFDRIIVSHGEVLESGGRDALAKGYAWLLPTA